MILPVMIWCLFAGTSAVTIVQDPPVLNITVGQNAVMSCEVREADNLQIIHYYWYLNNTNFTRENSTRITIVSNSINISSVTTDDIGIYTCIVRDSKLRSYQGNGTHLLVPVPTDPAPQDHYQHNYLYYLLFFIPLLLILFIYWIFRLPTMIGSQTHGTKWRDKWRWKKKDDDAELNYSAIVPQPNGAQIMMQMKTMDRREEVDYAPVKIAVSSLSLPYTSETSSMDNVIYVTLKTEAR